MAVCDSNWIRSTRRSSLLSDSTWGPRADDPAGCSQKGWEPHVNKWAGSRASLFDRIIHQEWSQPSGEWEIHFLTRVSVAASGADDNKSIAGWKPDGVENKGMGAGLPTQPSRTSFHSNYCPGWFYRLWTSQSSLVTRLTRETKPTQGQSGLVGELQKWPMLLCRADQMVSLARVTVWGWLCACCQGPSHPDPPHASIPDAHRGCTLIFETPEIKQATSAARNTRERRHFNAPTFCCLLLTC